MDYRDLICSFDWPCEQAMAVARCESTFRPWVTSPGGHAGLFQLSPQFHSWRLLPGESIYDPEANTRIAFEVWSQTHDWRAWSCRP